MTSAPIARAMHARKKIREKLRRRRDADELEDLLDRMELALIEAGRDAEKYYSWMGQSKAVRH